MKERKPHREADEGTRCYTYRQTASLAPRVSLWDLHCFMQVAQRLWENPS